MSVMKDIIVWAAVGVSVVALLGVLLPPLGLALLLRLTADPTSGQPEVRSRPEGPLRTATPRVLTSGPQRSGLRLG
jgi:hypothetical protein